MLVSKQFIIENKLNLEKENKNITYGKHKLVDAYKQLFDNISKGYHDKVIIWLSELMISYQFDKLFTKLIDYYFVNINITNYDIIHLLYSDYQLFITEKLLNNKEKKVLIDNHHNNQLVRNHLTQLASVLTLSAKNKIYSLPKITDSDFNFKLSITVNKIQYKHINLTDLVLKISDDNNIIIAVNEIMNVLKIQDKMNSSETHLFFWLNWLFEYDKRIKNKQYAARKIDDLISDCYLSDIVWIYWEIIRLYSKTSPYYNLINKLMYIYCYDYKTGQKNRKKNIIIMAFQLLLNTNNIPKCELFNNYSMTSKAVLCINDTMNTI